MPTRKNNQKMFTENETIALMHQERASVMRSLASHLEKHPMELADVVDFLREIADEAEAQVIVVELRDELKKL